MINDSLIVLGLMAVLMGAYFVSPPLVLVVVGLAMLLIGLERSKS